MDIENSTFQGKRKKISSCFQQRADFKYPQRTDKFNMHLIFFQRKKHGDNNIDILMGENNVFDKLIVMTDVSRLADKFDNFLLNF